MRGKILTVTVAAACVVGVGLGHGSTASAAVMAHSSAAQPAIHGAAQIPALPTAGSAADPDTTVTFDVNVGELSMTVPVSAAVGTGDPGTPIGPTPIGAVTVTDDRAGLSSTWTAVASSTDFTTGGGTPAETIPVADVTYTAGLLTSTTGVGTFTPSAAFTLSADPTTVVTATALTGNNSATWNPSLTIALPAAAVGGIYTGTLTHSVA